MTHQEFLAKKREIKDKLDAALDQAWDERRYGGIVLEVQTQQGVPTSHTVTVSQTHK